MTTKSEAKQTMAEMLQARFEQLEVDVVGHRDLEDGSEANVCEIRNECGDMIAEFVDEDDARYIVRALGVHQELFALAVRIAEHFENTDAPLGIEARRIIAKATT